MPNSPTNACAVEIRPVSPGDIDHVTEHMRAADVAEVRAAGHEPGAALQHSVARSAVCWTATANGAPAAIFGVARPVPLTVLSMALDVATGG